MNDWYNDMKLMHSHYGVHAWLQNTMAHEKDIEKMKKFLEFRMNFLKEEFDETMKAYENKDVEEMIDGMIDLCVIAIGTLEAFGVNANRAWDEVYHANMKKEVGIKLARPNPLGLPDLIKPEGWKAPSHKGNHGYFSNAL